ncbi:K Homology domain-containing protein [Artemisia annua]|uniref:K Homology domain-containing protein n=1 Tax=Artemisia annua TaxID=35608 RepID=A0A2U1MT53_ARTAN|nr:K Homology domain-containing protein [Artemisia annua]
MFMFNYYICEKFEVVTGAENGHHEEKEEEPKEDVTELSAELKNESSDGVKNDSVADENGEEAVKEEVQEGGGEERDAALDVVSQGDVSGVKDETVSGDGTSSRKMEATNNKGGEKLGYETEAFAIYDVMR